LEYHHISKGKKLHQFINHQQKIISQLRLQGLTEFYSPTFGNTDR